MSLETVIFNYLDDARRSKNNTTLNLGGASGPGGGVGGPSAGIIGKLVQTRVSYDESELATMATTVSGASLVDNLNHIRSRIQTLENNPVGGTITVKDDGVLKSSSITVIDFLTNLSVTTSGNVASITATGGGVGTGDVVGSGTSTDHAIARFEGATGKIIQNSLATVDDTGSIAIPNKVGYKINTNIVVLADTTKENYFFAGSGNTTTASGTYNYGFGKNALMNLTSGSYNVFVGGGGGNINTGSYNIGIGYGTMQNSTQAQTYNVAIGYNALLQNNGSYNVGIGPSAGDFALTTNGANNSIYIGYNAGHLNYYGKDNIFIGYSSGNGSQKSDAINTIAIGKDTYTTKDNQVVLGPSSITETVLRGSIVMSGVANAYTGNIPIVHSVDFGNSTVVSGFITVVGGVIQSVS